MKKIILICITLTTTLTTNAQWFGNKKVRGNGNVETVKRNTSDYDEVDVAGSFDVELIAGTEGGISITAEENLIPHIITEVRNGNLVIKTEQGYDLRPNKEILVTVPFESLNAVSLTGSGDVVTKNPIKTDQFEANLTGSGDLSIKVEANSVESDLTGSGDVYLSGKTTDFECTISGSGDIDAQKLKATNVDATISGSGDIDVYCDGFLKARVSGSGDIDYYGTPEKEDSKVSGSGDISRG